MDTLLNYNRYDNCQKSISHVLLHEFAHHIYMNHFSNYLQDLIYRKFQKLIESKCNYKNSANEFFAEMFSFLVYKEKEDLCLFEKELISTVSEYSDFKMFIN